MLVAFIVAVVRPLIVLVALIVAMVLPAAMLVARPVVALAFLNVNVVAREAPIKLVVVSAMMACIAEPAGRTMFKLVSGPVYAAAVEMPVGAVNVAV